MQRSPLPAPRPKTSLSRRTLIRGGVAVGALAVGGRGLAGARPAAAQRPRTSDAEREIRAQVGAFMEQNPTPGIAVAWVEPGRDLLLSFGVADVRANTPVTEDLVFTIGSVTKVFTATMLAVQAVDPPAAPAKNLADPVTDYLPVEIRRGAAIRRVTLKDLATHTAGFPNQGPDVEQPGAALFADQPVPADLADFWNTWTPPPGQRIGSTYDYSNVGYVTLGFAVVGPDGPPTGPGYRTLLRQLITGPLAMPMTSPDVVDSTEVTGYLVRGSTLRPVDPNAADLKSTAREMATWLKANLGMLDGVPRRLSRAFALAQQVHFDDARKRTAMGLGWQIFNQERGLPPIYLKNGASSRAGQSCVVGFAPESGIGVAVLTNAIGDVDPTPLGHNILRAMAI